MIMRALSRAVTRYRWVVLAITAVLLVLAGSLGGQVKGKLSSGGFVDPTAESSKAARILDEVFKTGSPNVVLLVTAKTGSVDDPAVAERGLALTGELASVPGLVEAVSYWSLGSPPPLRGNDSKQALVLGRVLGDEDDLRDAAGGIAERFNRQDATMSVEVGGVGEVFRQITEQAEADLQKAELLSFPVTLILLLVVFGSAVAAALPLAVGIIAVLGTFVVLTVFASFTPVSIFALNLTTAMGLGLAIDYSLFMVSRFREELGAGQEPAGALSRTMQTAGRTVAFSALTVAISLAALMVFPLDFLRSFAYAGVGVVMLAAVGAVVVLPAILSVLGRRIEKGAIGRRRRASVDGTTHEHASDVTHGFWYRRAHWVMARPGPVAVVVTLLLLVLGAPFLRFAAGQSDDRVLPPSSPVRQVNDELRRNFSSNEASALTVVAAPGSPSPEFGAIETFAIGLSTLPGVARVDAATGYYIDGSRVKDPDALSRRFAVEGSTWLSVVPRVEPLSPEGEAVVKAVRGADAPFGVLVGGPSAELVDSKSSLLARLPLALSLIVVATFVLLFSMTGSVVVPAKALVLNLLSLSATFGTLVWVFQDGHLSDLLGFTPTGTISVHTPILLFCIAFGLSMDYEVFLLSRIKEEYDLGHSNEESVAVGLEKTGGIVTAAALLLAVVFVAFATAEVAVVKVFGVGLTIAVLVDAFLIRTLLVPAFMKMAGRLNWWAPRSLRRFHLRYGVWESDPGSMLDLIDRAERSRAERADEPTRS